MAFSSLDVLTDPHKPLSHSNHLAYSLISNLTYQPTSGSVVSVEKRWQCTSLSVRPISGKSSTHSQLFSKNAKQFQSRAGIDRLFKQLMRWVCGGSWSVPESIHRHYHDFRTHHRDDITLMDLASLCRYFKEQCV